jgi:hypothetical protein
MISESLPGVRFGRDPSGTEKLGVLQGLGVSVPQELQQIFGKLPADERGAYEDGGLFLEFFLGTGPTVESLTVDVRGDGDPLRALRRLCEGKGWQVRGPGGKAIELQADDAVAGWAAFTQYRDEGVQQIKDHGTDQ